MDSRILGDRIREILGNRPGRPQPSRSMAQPMDEEQALAERCLQAEARADVLDVLGGRLIESAHGPCLVVQRDFVPGHRHGVTSVGDFAEHVVRSAGGLDLLWHRPGGRSGALLGDLAGGPPPDLLFFDLETTGLSGGAGTYAFLVGCGYFDQDGAFRTVQFFLRSYSEERALLDAVGAFVGQRGIGRDLLPGPRGAGSPRPVLVTYNGRAFDLPLIETRFLMHRIGSPFDAVPHLDMLHPARRLWRRRLTASGPPDGEWGAERTAGSGRRAADVAASCALTTLERDILGLSREDDVPGYEIPARYFQFARTGDARGLVQVFEHNRFDLLSLAALTAVVLRLVESGPPATRAPHECLALGRLYEAAGRVQQATECYRHVADRGSHTEAGEQEPVWVRIEGLRCLAARLHRERRHSEAAAAWQRLLGLEPDAATEGEACEALAIHHEHRSRDLESARHYAGRALERESDLRRQAGLRHRLQRLARKMERG